MFHDDFVFSHNKAKAFFYTIHFEGLEANSVLSGCQFALLMSNYYSRPFEFTTNASFSKHIVRISPGKQTFLDVDEMKKAFAFWKWLKFLLSHADAGATQPASTFLTSEHPHGIIAVPVKEDDPQQIDWDVIESVLNLCTYLFLVISMPSHHQYSSQRLTQFGNCFSNNERKPQNY